MTKRIIEISSEGCYLNLRHQQIIISKGEDELGSVPVEDMSALIIDHPQTILTQACLSYLLGNNVIVISSDASHQPVGMFLPLQTHSTQTERFALQANLSLPMKKSLWQQIIKAKVAMQARVLGNLTDNDAGISQLVKKVRSGDPDNIEAQAARRYWSRLFPENQFKRDYSSEDQNRFLNYGYAVIRALMARSLCASGLHPSLGIHHHNKYNAYCLADDCMEPYRPFVDLLVWEVVNDHGHDADMNKELRAKILGILSWEVQMGEEKLTFQGAMQKTAQSLAKVLCGEAKSLALPSV